jgi:nucleotidyltransferase/DNA polymerase involved in DNA repair
MKDCTGAYSHKGFLIVFSETYQSWSAEPDFLIEMFGSDNKVIDFISDHTYDIEPVKTIAKMKTAINKAIRDGLKEKLIEEFKTL